MQKKVHSDKLVNSWSISVAILLDGKCAYASLFQIFIIFSKDKDHGSLRSVVQKDKKIDCIIMV